MTLNPYEALVILPADLSKEAWETMVELVRQRIRERQGTIEQEVVWGRRRLAYQIKKAHEGMYLFFRFRMPSEGLGSLEQAYRLEERIVRHLIIRRDERFDAVTALVPSDVRGPSGGES